MCNLSRSQGRQIKQKESDKSSLKGFLKDLSLLGMFREEAMASGTGVLSTNERGNPTLDIAGYIPWDKAMARPPSQAKWMGKFNSPRGFVITSEIHYLYPPADSFSFWLSYGPSEEDGVAKHEMTFSKLRAQRTAQDPRPAPLVQGPMTRDPMP